MKWLVTGARGMLGQDVQQVLAAAGEPCTPVDLGDLDLFDAEAVDAAVAAHDVVLNCAAWTAVDDAEAQEATAFGINAVAPAVIGRAARRAGSRVVQISTDYVFDGGSESYAEDAVARPRSAYGRTKAAGEWAVRAEAPEHHLVVRTAWLYGARGSCFPRTIARLARERGAIQVVDDQVGQPTWTRDVATMVLRLVREEVPAGTYHATSGGRTSWFGFARAVVGAAGLSPEVITPTTTEAFPSPAHRPASSVLEHDALRRLGIDPIGPWEERWALAASEVLALDQPE